VDRQDKFSARMALPGFDAKDISVTATPDCLVMYAGHHKILLHRLEIPSEIDIDKVTASLEKGILQITAPKVTVKHLHVAA
jgi:HSP20 family molecular chaperone IbpA